MHLRYLLDFPGESPVGRGTYRPGTQDRGQSLLQKWGCRWCKQVTSSRWDCKIILGSDPLLWLHARSCSKLVQNNSPGPTSQWFWFNWAYVGSGHLYFSKLPRGFSYPAGVEEPLPKGESFRFFIPSSCLEDTLFGPSADVQFSLYHGRVPYLWFNSMCPCLLCSRFLKRLLLECGGLKNAFFQPIIRMLTLMWFSGSRCLSWLKDEEPVQLLFFLVL